jgi:calcineurin-like phosphoesterase
MPDKISFLFLGDVIGRPGRRAIDRFLPGLVKRYRPTLIIANGENAAGGIGITEKVGKELLNRVDVLTSGNHIWDKREAISYMREEPRLLRPANYPPGNPGKGTYVFEDEKGRKIGILSLLEIERLREITPVVIVDFHAEATSEKQALGWYLDGKASAVIGTHTHVPTADERILPQGTAYITDVGMVGGYNSVIGIRRDQAMDRFLTARPQRFEPGKDGVIFTSIFVEIDHLTGKALSIQKKIIIEDDRGEQREDQTE